MSIAAWALLFIVPSFTFTVGYAFGVGLTRRAFRAAVLNMRETKRERRARLRG
jgi:hypothetical protein